MQAYSLSLDIISACWIAFVAVWLLAAVSTKRAAYRESRAQRLRSWVLLVIAYLLLVHGRQLPYPLNLHVIPYASPIAWAGAAFPLARPARAPRARDTLGGNRTAA